MKKIFFALVSSHVLFIASGSFYSVYWVSRTAASGQGEDLFIGASLVCGLVAVMLAGTCIKALVQAVTQTGMKLSHVVSASLAIFGVCALVTSGIMGREFTSELPLAVLWAGIEYCALLLAFYARILTKARAVASAVIIGCALAIGLACYSIHYLLDGIARFYNGLVPYAAVSAAMLALIGLLVPGFRKAGEPGESD